ncbi:MAG: P-loop NTPase fold protein [Fimbriimonadaceae bacterium]
MKSTSAIEHDADDLYSFGVVADNYAGVLEKLPSPVTIAVLSSWGTGKSSLLSLLSKRLNDKGIGTAVIKSWEYDDGPNLFASVCRELAKKNSQSMNAISKLASSISVNASLPGVSASVDLGNLWEGIKEEIESSKLGKKIAEHKRFYVIFDEIDRCKPEQILSILDGVALYGDRLGCDVILSVSRHTLESALAYKYKRTLDMAYFDKCWSYVLPVPHLSASDIIAGLRNRYKEPAPGDAANHVLNCCKLKGRFHKKIRASLFRVPICTW